MPAVPRARWSALHRNAMARSVSGSTKTACVYGCLLAVLLVGALPANAGARSWRFRADVTVYQTVSWNQAFRDLHCGDDSGNYFVYRGVGSGTLRVSARRLYVTFRDGRFPGLTSTEFRAPGTVYANASYSAARQTDPNENCEPRPIEPLGVRPNPACGATRRGSARMRLTVYSSLRPFYGKAQLTGAFYGRGYPNFDIACPDPSALTGAVGYGGTSAQRNIGALIRYSRIGSSISLTAYRRKTLRVRELLTPGAATQALSGSGTYTARWSVRLTRI